MRKVRRAGCTRPVGPQRSSALFSCFQRRGNLICHHENPIQISQHFYFAFSGFRCPGLRNRNRRIHLLCCSQGSNQAREQDGLVFETMHRRKDGTSFPVEISKRAIQIMDKTFYLGIIREISERKQAEKALKGAHDSLERRVRERTSDLQVMNERLQQEIEVRIRAEHECRAVTVAGCGASHERCGDDLRWKELQRARQEAAQPAAVVAAASGSCRQRTRRSLAFPEQRVEYGLQDPDQDCLPTDMVEVSYPGKRLHRNGEQLLPVLGNIHNALRTDAGLGRHPLRPISEGEQECPHRSAEKRIERIPRKGTVHQMP
ncbi:MAG: PAS domain S-box protein [Deltaproteobacteria bacterium]|nr:MAG: PAS domain S-box protein [Deltaproteobacteria bacterium]